MPEKILIINADDYGLTPDVSRGIRFAHENGVVTSTTALMNSNDIARDLELARYETPSLGLGVHLNLTLGKSLLPAHVIPSIVDKDGNFMSLAALKSNLSKINSDHVYQEWKAQIERMLSLGSIPDHLDSHHHVSFRSAELYNMMLRLADEYFLPIRTSPAYLSGNCRPFDAQTSNVKERPQQLTQNPVRIDFYNEGVTIQHLTEILQCLVPGIMELMVHPAYDSPRLHELSSYSETRERELAILTSAEIIRIIQALGITLESFKIFQNSN